MALKTLRKDLITATIAVLAFTLLLGILYPLVIIVASVLLPRVWAQLVAAVGLVLKTS